MKWLHLSDLHYNPQRDGTSTWQMREKLLKYLKEEHITAEHLFLTGDYRHAAYQRDNEESAAAEAARYILRIAEEAEVSPANIHVIPGNHDLSRTTDTDRIKRIKENYDAHNGRFRQEDADFLLERFSFFRRLNQELSKQGVDSPWGEGMLPLHTYRCFDEFSLLLLNTSVLCNSDSDRGELLIGNFDLYQTLEKISEENHDKPIIALAHHGLDNYREDEKKAVEKLFEEYPVKLYLCGDAHMPWKRRTNEVLEITMGCLLQDKNVRTVFSVGEWKGGAYSIEAHEWDADENEWGEYTQFNKKLRQWFLRNTPEKAQQAEVITREYPDSPAAYFRGRDAKTAEIEEILFHKAKIVLLYGIGGSGKTEICRHLFWRYVQKASEGIVTKIGWIVYQDTMKNSFYGQFQEISANDTEEYWIKTELLIRQMREKLLLIIDNANDITPQEITLLDKLGCRVLLTSRRKAERIVNVEIDGLSPEESRQLYRLHSQDNVSEDEVIDKIILLAARHILSLELLAKTQYAAGINAGELLQILQNKGFDLTEIKEAVTCFHGREYENERMQDKPFIEHMAKIFDISEVRQRTEELEVLQGLSLLAPGIPVPFQTVKRWLDMEDFNAMNSVIRKGWVIRINTEEAPSIMMHPVISAVIRYAAMPEEERKEVLIKNVGCDLQFKNDEIFVDKKDIVPHAEAIAKSALMFTTDYAVLIEWLALIYSGRGESKKALEYDKKALKIYEKVQGKDFAGAGRVYSNIACTYDKLGNYQEALKWYDKSLLLKDGEQTLSAASLYANIASVYSNLNEYDRALEWYRKAEKIYQEIVGEEHVDIVRVYNGIACVYLGQSEYDKALEYYEKALDICERELGQDHLETARIYNNIAAVFGFQGKYGKALECYMKSAGIRENVLGRKHPDIATTYSNIAFIYHKLGEYEKADEWNRKSIEVYEETLGKEHPKTARTYNNAASVYLSWGKYQKAQEWFMKALKVLKTVLGEEHPDIACIYINIGMIHYKQGEYDKALEWYRKALKIYEGTLGEECYEAAAIYNNIGLAYTEKGEYRQARKWFVKALQVFKKMFQGDHPDIARACQNIGMSYCCQKKCRKAQRWLVSAIDMYERMPEKDYHDVAIAYTLLATVCYYQGKYGSAQNWVVKAMALYGEKMEDVNPDIASVCYLMGLLYHEYKKYEEAEIWLEKAAEIYEEWLGKNHPLTVIVYNNIRKNRRKL